MELLSANLDNSNDLCLKRFDKVSRKQFGPVRADVMLINNCSEFLTFRLALPPSNVFNKNVERH